MPNPFPDAPKGGCPNPGHLLFCPIPLAGQPWPLCLIHLLRHYDAFRWTATVRKTTRSLGMQLGSTKIIDTFAEAFGMWYVRLLVTAFDAHWLDAALREFTGYSSSVIACDAEAGIESYVDAEHTPDGRCGATVLVFGFSAEALAKAVPNRTGQCLMTCPTTAVYNGMPDAKETIPLGKHIRYFGDGFSKKQKTIWPSVLENSCHGWRISGGRPPRNRQRGRRRKHHPAGG